MMKADQIGPQINEVMKFLIQSFINMHKIYSSLYGSNYILTKEFLKIIVCPVKLIVFVLLGKYKQLEIHAQHVIQRN